MNRPNEWFASRRPVFLWGVAEEEQTNDDGFEVEETTAGVWHVCSIFIGGRGALAIIIRVQTGIYCLSQCHFML